MATQGLDIPTLTRQLADNTARIQELSTISTDAITQAAQQSYEAAGQEAAANRLKAEVKLRNQAIAGLDTTVQGNEYQKAMDVLNIARDEYQTNRQQYDQIAQMSLMDNPVGYLFAQLQLPTVVAKTNSAVDAMNAAKENLAARQALLKQQNDVQVVDTIQQDNAVAKLKAESDLTKSLHEVAKAKIGNVKDLTTPISAQISAINIEHDNRLKDIQAAAANALRKQNAEEHKVRMDEARELRQLRLEQLKTKMEQEGTYKEQLLNTGRILGYKTDLTPELMAGLSAPVQQAIKTVALTQRLGADLPEAFNTLIKLPGAESITSMNPGMQQTVRQLEQYKVSAEQQLALTNKALPAKDRPYEAMSALQQKIESSVNDSKSVTPSSSNMWDTTPNPVLINPVLTSNLPQLANNPVAKAIQTVISTKGEVNNLGAKDLQTAYNIVRDQVVAGTLPPSLAAKAFVEYARAGVAKSAEFTKYELLGLKKPDAYYTQFEARGMFGDVYTANLLSEASVLNALVKELRGIPSASSVMKGLVNAHIATPFGEE